MSRNAAGGRSVRGGGDSAASPRAGRGQPAHGAPWFVYIVRCADGTFYTGIAKDLDRRIAQHNAGTASRYTRSRRPVQAAWCEPQPSQSAALKREAAVKAMTRRQKNALVAERRAIP